MRVSAGFLVSGLSGKTRIQTRPPRLMWRVSATRAASISRAVSQPRLDRLQAEVAERERRAAPRRAAAAALLHLAVFDLLRVRAWIVRLRRRAPARCSSSCSREHLAAEDPDLDADDAVGGLGLGEAVVDVGAQRVQRHAALAVPLAARDLGAAEAARRLDADALRAHAHRARDRFLHRAAERDAALELQRDVLGDELRVEVGPPHLVDVDEASPCR